MTREFLENLGIGEDAAAAILEESQKETRELAAQLEEEINKGNAREKEHLVEEAVRSFGARNVKAVKALLDIDAAEESEDFSLSLQDQLKKLKEENEFLFGDSKAPRVVGQSGKTGGNAFGFKFAGVR